MTKLRTGIILFLFLLVVSLLFMGRGEIDMVHYLEGPSLKHVFGFDSLGRDLFSRSCYGLVISLSAAAVSCLMSLVIASGALLCMRRNGIVRTVTVSVMKAVRIVPSVILALFLLSFAGNGAVKLVLVLSLGGGCTLSLLLEPLLKSLGREEYITAERSLGLTERRIFFRHILPSLSGVIREHLSSSFITSVLTESSLSFLGLGFDPSVPTLGRILSEGRAFALTHPHVVVFPALVLLLLGLSVLLIQKGLSEFDSSLHRTHQR